MAIRSGLGGQVGFAKEGTYGTYAAPTKFIEIASESLQKVVNRVDGGGMAAGRLTRLASRRTETNTMGSGTLQLQVTNKNMGILFENLMGPTETPTQVALTTAYEQVHDLGDNWDKSFTIQKGVVDIDTGTARPYNFLGSKISAAEFTCGVDEDLQMSIDIDSREVEDTSTLVAASYPSGLEAFTFRQGVFKTGATVGGATNTTGVRRMTCRIERPMKTDRFQFNQGGLKTQPILNDYTNITGTIDIDFMNTTDFIDRFIDNDTFAIVWTFTGSLIEAGHNFTWELRLPACILDGAIPQLDGPDISQISVPYVVRSNGTDAPATIYVKSDETTL